MELKQAMEAATTGPPPSPATPSSSRLNVFWIGQTPDGPAALVTQEVRVRTSEHPATLVGLVADGGVVDRKAGLYRFGPVSDPYVAPTLGRTVPWSSRLERGAGNRLTRTWVSAPQDQDGAVVRVAPLSDRPVFVRGDSVPKPDDFTQPLIMGSAFHQQGALLPHPGLGRAGQYCASPIPGQLGRDRQLERLRMAARRPLRADVGKVVRGDSAVLPLPDGQGTIVAEFNATVGPQERDHA